MTDSSLEYPPYPVYWYAMQDALCWHDAGPLPNGAASAEGMRLDVLMGCRSLNPGMGRRVGFLAGRVGIGYGKSLREQVRRVVIEVPHAVKRRGEG